MRRQKAESETYKKEKRHKVMQPDEENKTEVLLKNLEPKVQWAQKQERDKKHAHNGLQGRTKQK